MSEVELKGEEKLVQTLRTLYGSYGYRPYRMSRFEEYDLYMENKDFLVSNNIITFTDTDGKLMALKPDVTLSIVKSLKDGKGPVTRVCYDENVYRISDKSGTFREIMQAGLECIGPVDMMQLVEVVVLAQKSLDAISYTHMLSLSHMGIVEEFLDDIPSEDLKNEILKLLGSKNVPELKKLAEANPSCSEAIGKIEKLAMMVGANEETLSSLEAMGADVEAVAELKTILSALDEKKVRLDFSVLGGMNYYNGIIFRGYVEGVPGSILSGGQYDKLMARMGRKSRAVGFAVYLDSLERLLETTPEYDTDYVLLYREEDDISSVMRKAEELRKTGASVTAVKSLPEKLKYRQVVTMGGNGNA